MTTQFNRFCPAVSRYQSNGPSSTFTITLFVWKCASKDSVPHSRPMPERPTPPQGDAGSRRWADAPEVVAFRRERLARVDAQCFARACLGLAELDLTPRLADIRNRTLVMCGSLDQTTPPALARQVASGIQGAQYVEIEGSGHCPMLERPQALVAAMRAFMDASALVR